MQKQYIIMGIIASLLIIPVVSTDVFATDGCIGAYCYPAPKDNVDVHVDAPNTPREISNPPSMSGFNTRDVDRFEFVNVIEQPIIVMDTTQAKILVGKATSQFVHVFFDDKYLTTLDIGVEPLGTPHNEWISFGGMVLDVPFEAYYEISETGQLNYVGQYNQLRHVDGVGSITYEESPDTDSEEED